MKWREENSIFRRAMGLQSSGRKPAGKLKKTWQACIKEDLTMLNITEEAAHDGVKWRGFIACPTSMGRKGQETTMMMMMMMNCAVQSSDSET